MDILTQKLLTKFNFQYTYICSINITPYFLREYIILQVLQNERFRLQLST